MSEIKLIVFDVDGTLTSGEVHMDATGVYEHKHFSIADGIGFRMAHSVGIKIAVVSGRQSLAVVRRMQQLNVEDVFTGVNKKDAVVVDLKSKYGLEAANLVSVGDDINDLPVFRETGLKVAVANAVPQLKRAANYITSARGGAGAAREAIEWILRRQGLLATANHNLLEMFEVSSVRQPVQ